MNFKIKLLGVLFALSIVYSNAQITKLKDLNSSIYIYGQMSEDEAVFYNYYCNTSLAEIYDTDFNLLKTVDLPEGYFVRSISKYLYNLDNNYELELVNSLLKKTIVISEDGNALFEIENCSGVICFNTATGTKMIIQHTDNVTKTEIYSLPGKMYYNSHNGTKGEKGEQGIQGIQGLKGDQGEKGEQGIQGIQGLKGDKGEKGDQGIQGIQGLKGNQGEKGEQGIQGIQGLKGEKGEKGDQGIQGIQGLKGDQGDDGKSAYQIWLDQGHSGSKDDFLNWLKQVDKTTDVVSVKVMDNYYLTSPAPNPVDNSVINYNINENFFSAKIVFYSSVGNYRKEIQIFDNKNSIYIDRSNFPISGVYLYRIETDKGVSECKKLVVK